MINGRVQVFPPDGFADNALAEESRGFITHQLVAYAGNEWAQVSEHFGALPLEEWFN